MSIWLDTKEIYQNHSTHPGIIASPVSGKPNTASSPEPSKMGNDQTVTITSHLNQEDISVDKYIGVNYELYQI